MADVGLPAMDERERPPDRETHRGIHPDCTGLLPYHLDGTPCWLWLVVDRPLMIGDLLRGIMA